MNFKSPLIVVRNMEQSLDFYREILGLKIILDFGANVTLTGGFSLQTQESWEEFIQKDEACISYGGNDSELYFEEDDFDKFIEKLQNYSVEYVHPVFEHRWGQRVVRFYDPDKHIIEVGENIKVVCKHFFNSGMTINEVAQRMDVSVDYVNECLR